MPIKQEIIDVIKEYQTIMIHRHQSPDPDALGSQGGLADIIRRTYPDKKVYTVGGEVGDLSYLNTMDNVTNEMYQGALVIVTDTANAPRISGEQYSLGEKLIKIDHHPDDEPYGDISWVEPSASSTSEMIYDLYEANSEELVMPSEAARLLYAGIVGDTGRFLYPSTTAHTLEVASKLRRYDFDAAKLSRFMDEVDEKIARLTGYVYDNLIIDDSGAAMIILSNELMQEYDIEDSDTHALVPLPGRIHGIISWGIFVEQPLGGYRVRLRSKGPVINGIAKRHHGGGHPLASGAKAVDKEEIEVIFQELITVATEAAIF